MTEEQKSFDSWDDFSGDYLKAVNVQSEEDDYLITGLSRREEEGRGTILTLELERLDRKWSFDLNKTNVKFLTAESGSPEDLIGKVIYFKKVLVNNPQTKTEVESLRISKVLDPNETVETMKGGDENGN